MKKDSLHRQLYKAIRTCNIHVSRHFEQRIDVDFFLKQQVMTIQTQRLDIAKEQTSRY